LAVTTISELGVAELDDDGSAARAVPAAIQLARETAARDAEVYQ